MDYGYRVTSKVPPVIGCPVLISSKNNDARIGVATITMPTIRRIRARSNEYTVIV